MKPPLSLTLAFALLILIGSFSAYPATDYPVGKVVTLRQGVKVFLGKGQVVYAHKGHRFRIRSVKDDFIIGDTLIEEKRVGAFVHKLAIQQDQALTKVVPFEWGSTTRLEMRVPRDWVGVPEGALELLSGESFQSGFEGILRLRLGLPAGIEGGEHEWIGAWGLPETEGPSKTYIAVSARCRPDPPANWDPKIPEPAIEGVLDLFTDDRAIAAFAGRYSYLTSEDTLKGWFFNADQVALVFCAKLSLAGEERFGVSYVLFRSGARIQINGYCAWHLLDDFIGVFEDAVVTLTVTQCSVPPVSEWASHALALPNGTSLAIKIPSGYSRGESSSDLSDTSSAGMALQGSEAWARYLKEDGNQTSMLTVLALHQELASEMEALRVDALVAQMEGPMREELKAQIEVELGCRIKTIAVADSGQTEQFTYVDLSAELEGEVGGLISRSTFLGIADGRPVALLFIGNTSLLRAEWRQIAAEVFAPVESTSHYDLGQSISPEETSPYHGREPPSASAAGSSGPWFVVALVVVIAGLALAVVWLVLRNRSLRARYGGLRAVDDEVVEAETEEAEGEWEPDLGGPLASEEKEAEGERERDLGGPFASVEPEADAVVCTACYAEFEATPRRSFLGFLRYVCPHCGKRILYPLTPGYRGIYWVLLILMVAVFFWALWWGGFAVPGGVGIAVIVALVKDASIRQATEAARYHARMRSGHEENELSGGPDQYADRDET